MGKAVLPSSSTKVGEKGTRRYMDLFRAIQCADFPLRLGNFLPMIFGEKLATSAPGLSGDAEAGKQRVGAEVAAVSGTAGTGPAAQAMDSSGAVEARSSLA